MTQASAGPANHCPFGCSQAELDEHGYCDHLVGWTNDGQTYEKLVRGRRGLRQIDCNQLAAADGPYVRHVCRLLPGDVLVNPVSRQLVDTLWHEAKKWVSARVYRKGVQRQPLRQEIVSTEEIVEEEIPESATEALAESAA